MSEGTREHQTHSVWCPLSSWTGVGCSDKPSREPQERSCWTRKVQGGWVEQEQEWNRKRHLSMVNRKIHAPHRETIRPPGERILIRNKPHLRLWPACVPRCLGASRAPCISIPKVPVGPERAYARNPGLAVRSWVGHMLSKPHLISVRWGLLYGPPPAVLRKIK